MKNIKYSKISSPWRTIHASVWLIGLAVLAWQDWWWPGILVLVAISILVEAALRRYAPQSFELTEQLESTQDIGAAPVQPLSAVEYPIELLPSECPRCGAPVGGHEVKWTGRRSANCSYCGGNLPLFKNENISGD